MTEHTLPGPGEPRRNSNVEWLRVASMLMIVAYHYSIWGFFEEELAATGNKTFVDLFGMLGKAGTDLFVLISGYYMAEQSYSIKKFLNLMGTVWFYTIGAMLCLGVLGGQPVTRLDLEYAFLPLKTSHYWFVNYYVLLMLCTPFLNRLVHALDRKQHALLCAFCIGLVTVVPEFAHVSYAAGSLPLFVTLYVCAAYCRLHVRHELPTARRCLLLAAVLLGLCVLRIVLTDMICRRTGNMERLMRSTAFMGAYSPFALALGVLLLIGAACRPAGTDRLGARLGGLTFGVYLFQSNNYVSEALWQGILNTRAYTASPLLPLHALGSVAGVFAAGLLVEYLRQITLGRLWKKLTDRIAPPLERLLSAAFDRLLAAAERLLRL